jgi:predicted HicB family RNase H-like nuclease
MKGKILEYGEYKGSVEISIEDGLLHGKLLFIDGLVSYAGSTVAELSDSFRSAVDEYLASCARRGVEPQRPYCGTFNIRIGAELHRRAAQYAYETGGTLNDVVKEALTEKLRGSKLVSGVRATSAVTKTVLLLKGSESYSLAEDESSTEDFTLPTPTMSVASVRRDN